MSLGKNVRALRLARGWDLEELSRRSKVKGGTISAIELRESRRSQFAPELAAAFGLTVEQLMADETSVQSIPAKTDTVEGSTGPVGAGDPSIPRQEAAAGEFTLARALQVVAEALQDVDEMTRETAAALLSNLAKAPSSQPNIAAAMQALLHFSSGRGVETRDLVKQPEQAK